MMVGMKTKKLKKAMAVAALVRAHKESKKDPICEAVHIHVEGHNMTMSLTCKRHFTSQCKTFFNTEGIIAYASINVTHRDASR